MLSSTDAVIKKACDRLRVNVSNAFLFSQLEK